MKVKLYPRCISFEQQPTLSATGYVVPCCWADSVDFKGMESLVQPHLHISNVDDIEDIITSEEWDSFFEGLIKKPGSAPDLCKKYCCTDTSFKNRKINEVNSK